MKKTFRAIVIAVAAVTALVACSKEMTPGEAGKMEKGKIGVSVSALMAELTPAEAGTKASVASVVRLTWEDADTVSAFCGSEYLGHLDVSVSDDNKMVAKLSGELTAPTSGSTITLIHSNIKPTVSGNTVSVDFSDQKTVQDPFVVYGTLANTETNITNQVVPFKFATSLMFVTVTGLDNSNVDSVMVSGINTVCQLTVKTDGEPTVAGTEKGIITTDKIAVHSDERAIVHIGIVKDSNTGRKITAVQGGTKSGADFTANELAASASYISVYALKVKETADYVVMKMGSDQSKTLKWRKMNLGATTVAGSASTCYGNLYSWGNPTGSNGDNITSPGFTDANYQDPGKSISKAEDWVTATHDAAYKALGGKWRMPTFQEFKDLADACGGSSSYNTSKNPGKDTSVDKGIYWCTNYDGVAGCLFCDGTNKLFFPAAGYSGSTSRSNDGSRGSYWSDTWDSADRAYNLIFHSSGVYPQNNISRYYGRSVRPVSD